MKKPILQNKNFFLFFFLKKEEEIILFVRYILCTQSYRQYDVALFIRMNKILIHQNEGKLKVEIIVIA